MFVIFLDPSLLYFGAWGKVVLFSSLAEREGISQAASLEVHHLLTDSLSLTSSALAGRFITTSGEAWWAAVYGVGHNLAAAAPPPPGEPK